jgi:hypothetical protein
MKHCLSLILRVCFFLALIAATPAFAATVAVGTCMPNKVSFDSLTDAVQGVPPGSTILVCPGVYAEQIVINKSLTLKGQTFGNSAYPVIMPPPGGLASNAAGLNAGLSFFGAGTPFAAQVLIESGADVTITNMAVDATGFNIPVCGPFVVGILIQDASATLDGVVVKNQLQQGPFPCFGSGAGGQAVLAQSDNASPVNVKIQNSSLINAGQGYESDGASITTTLINNSFSGNPASNGNAINVFSGNSTIRGNTISNFIFPAAPDANSSALAILMECVPGGTVVNNTLAGNQVGIFLQNPGCPTTGVSITGNNVYSTQFIAIDVGETNGLVQGNDIRSSQTAIRLPGAAAGNTIRGNSINDTCAAFGSNPAAGVNTILTNNISNAQNLAIVNTTGSCP